MVLEQIVQHLQTGAIPLVREQLGPLPSLLMVILLEHVMFPTFQSICSDKRNSMVFRTDNSVGALAQQSWRFVDFAKKPELPRL
jgi:hypothetical protein